MKKKPTKTEYFKSGYEFGHSKRVIRIKKLIITNRKPSQKSMQIHSRTTRPPKR